MSNFRYQALAFDNIDATCATAARQVVQLYPTVKAELETMLTWKVDFRPMVLLVPDRKTFANMAGAPREGLRFGANCRL
jgi:hypothetical protein